MELEGYSESELLRALSLDLDTAFPQLVQNYHSELYRSVVYQVKSQQDAEDIMQDGWPRVYQALGQYSEKRILSLRLRAWLFTIFHNQMRTYLRKKKSSDTTPIDDLNDDVKADWMLQPENIVVLKSQIEEVRAAAEQLPPACRAVLTRLLQGLSYSEIAAELGQPVENVRTYASRGAKLLREQLFASI